MLDGNPLILGFSLSITVTVKLDVLIFPLASVAVYITVVVPIEKTPPFVVPDVCAIE